MPLLSCGIAVAERLFPSAPNSLTPNDDGKGKHAEPRTAQGGGASEHLAADLVNGIGDGPLEGSVVGEHSVTVFPREKESGEGQGQLSSGTITTVAQHPPNGHPVGPKTIDILPEDALLEIFNFFTDGSHLVERWHALVHVCQRWRWVVFASQRRLNLRLLCTAGKPVRDMLGVWPALPIQIQESWGPPTPTNRRRRSRSRSPASDSGEGADNIIAALEHSDRVCEIVLRGAPSALLERFGAAAARDPFPALTHLELWSNDRAAPPTLPDSFLGGTAPRLRTLFLNNVAFPAVWTTLLAPAAGADCLVHLRLWHIPDSGYISPRLMVACLSSLTRLESLELGWRSPRSHPDRASRRFPPPLTPCTVLPALVYFRFKGVSEHLEDLVARIDVPRLRAIKVTFFNQLIFDTPQVLRFINHTEQLRSINRADMVFYNHSVEVKLAQVDLHELVFKISCRSLEWQLSSLAQVCSSSLPPLPALERLDIRADQNSRPRWQDDIDNAQWLEILRPFTAVKDLHLSWALTSRVMPTLQDLARESVTGVLPVLQNLFLEGVQPPGPAQKAIKEFVAARKRSGHPITVHRWERGW